MILYAEFLISHKAMVKVVKKFKQKKHAKMGYAFEYEEYKSVGHAARANPALIEKKGHSWCCWYDDQTPYDGAGGVLRIYRDVPSPA
jgi:hypothetical protein